MGRIAVVNDGLTQAGANRLAATIKAFWASMGKFPSVWVEQLTIARPDDQTRNAVVYCVRSNMVRGNPVA